MNNSSAAVEFIEPKNELILKTGTGGLKQGTLDAVQSRVESMKLDIEPFLKEKVVAMKSSVYSDNFMANDNSAVINDFIAHLVAFNVHIKLVKNNGLAHVSGSLLRFVERLDTMNVDSYHVIKAHLNAIDIIVKTSLTNMNQQIIDALIKELNDACTRYNAKYNGD